MSNQFYVRRDSSTNNVPTVGYNDGADAQDVILFGASEVKELLTTDGTGSVTLGFIPVSINGEVFIDNNNIRRARNLNDDIIITSEDGTINYYAGYVNAADRTLKVYINESRASVTMGTKVYVTYYKRTPLNINVKGELRIETIDIKPKEKVPIMYKKEGTIVAGASSTAIDLLIGDNKKDKYITSIIAYYNGMSNDDPKVGFWFSQLENGVNTGWADMLLPNKFNDMLQLYFGETGVKIAANGTFRFSTSSSWVQNYVHVCAYGWQYAD